VEVLKSEGMEVLKYEVVKELTNWNTREYDRMTDTNNNSDNFKYYLDPLYLYNYTIFLITFYLDDQSSFYDVFLPQTITICTKECFNISFLKL